MKRKKKKTYIFCITMCLFTTIMLGICTITNNIPLLIIPFLIDLFTLIVVIICFVLELKSPK